MLKMNIEYLKFEKYQDTKLQSYSHTTTKPLIFIYMINFMKSPIKKGYTAWENNLPFSGQPKS